MKGIKKILMLAFTGILCFALGILSACGANDSSTSTPDEKPTEYVYSVRVQSEGGFGLRGVGVSLYSGEKKIAAKTTSAKGDAYFTKEDVIAAGEYEIRFSELPAGWSLKEGVTYKTTEQEQTDYTALALPELLLENAPASKRYRLGDVMYDFSVLTSDNRYFTLSEVLEEKKAVLLNFWATWCGPCKSEFPAMQNAYVETQDDIAVLAVSTTDTQSAVKDYKAQQGLSFDMAGETEIAALFNPTSIPVSIIIDRYGVISYWHVGSMTAKSDFLGLFDKFTGENYVQTVIQDGDYTGEGNDGTEEEERVKPNVSAPAFSDLDAVLDPNNLISEQGYRWDEDEYSWCWTIETPENGEKYLRAANADVHNSYSILHFDYTATANSALALDAMVSTEVSADYFYVFVDGTIVQKISGVSDDTFKEYVLYVFEEQDAGKHEISLCYLKDSSATGGEDEVWVKNLHVLQKSSLAAREENIDVFRFAATGKNAATGDKPAANAKKKLFNNYITPVYNETDGYYHVGAANGPLLLTDVMNPTGWNIYDLWQLAYNKYLVVEGMNLEQNIEDYAWAATNSDNGYVPVTKDLKELFELITSVDTYGETRNKDYHLSNYAEEWLELCVYFDHYGTQPQPTDPTRGITFDGAIEIAEGVTEIDCFRSIVPLGIKHKFTPQKSGVYRFRSLFDKSAAGISASVDPQCWIVAKDKTTFLAYNDDNLLDVLGNPDNFEIYLYLEKDEPYYALFAMFLNAIGKFDLEIEYIGESYAHLTNAATGPYSYNTVTSETFVPNAKTAKLGEDGYYHVVEKDENGNEVLGSKLYVDLTHATYLFPSDTLQNLIENAKHYGIEKRLFYLDDGQGGKKDYTPIMQKYLLKALFNGTAENGGSLYGLVEIDETLMDILLKLTKAHDGFGGIKNSWQMLCYYYQTVEKA
ncbi:MAG: TlpA family protein disulfide reductase [Clostridia bacterium]|nr:TlpA family protein disulfide reductase [Clostridia bacterium]